MHGSLSLNGTWGLTWTEGAPLMHSNYFLGEPCEGRDLLPATVPAPIHQVLMDNGLFDGESAESATTSVSAEQGALFARILDTFANQYAGWQRMNIFERQWVLRDFKKSMGISTDQAQEELRRVADVVSGGTAVSQKDRGMLDSLRQYWEHQLKLLRGYEKNPIKLEESARIIEGWIDDIVHFLGE